MKQTEIGLIPDDWEVKKLGNITTHVDYRGKTPKKTNMGIQLITAKNIRMGYIDYKNNQEFVSPTDYSEVMKRGLPQKGDVLITTEAPAGNVAQIDNENIALAQRVIKYRGNETLNNDYLCHYFLSDCFQNLLRAMNTGGTVQGIKGSLLHTLPVIVPPLPEQQRIAKALSDVDAAISTIELLIQKKKNIKQGTMQNLLTGKKRLPGFAKSNKTKITEIGEIPEDWEIKSLGEITETFTGLTYSPKDVYEYGTLVLRSSNIKDGHLCYEDNVYVQMDIPERAIVREGDILICVRNGSKALIGKSTQITNEASGMAFGAFMTVLRTDKIDQNFLLYIWQSDKVQKQVADNLGATINQITNADFNKFWVTIPSNRKEQTAIANVLSSMDNEIETLNTKLEKYRNLKTAMMQQLLTGKIRL